MRTRIVNIEVEEQVREREREAGEKRKTWVRGMSGKGGVSKKTSGGIREGDRITR